MRRTLVALFATTALAAPALAANAPSQQQQPNNPPQQQYQAQQGAKYSGAQSTDNLASKLEPK